MLECDWALSAGWSKQKVVPYHPFTIDPLNSTLHYALTCFEGKTFIIQQPEIVFYEKFYWFFFFNLKKKNLEKKLKNPLHNFFKNRVT